MPQRINVTMSSMPSLQEYIEEISPLWESRWLSNRGGKSLEFEEMLRDYLDTPNIWLFANGHLALEVTLQALDLEGEVITTPYTHCSTTHAIVRNGLTPVFSDIREADFTIDPAQIEEKITDRTCAIVATHVYGFLCDVEEIERIAKRHGLYVVYDAAHAFGTKRKGVSAANFGDAAMFSTHATKVFHTIEGGIVSYKDADLFASLRYLVNFGFTSPEDIDYIGTNARMNEFEAAMGICNLRHLDEDLRKRRMLGERYYERLEGACGIRLVEIPADLEWNYAYMPVLFEGDMDRDAVKRTLEEHDVFARKYFYPSMDEAACYQDASANAELAVSHYVADHILTLPMYAGLECDDVDRICDIVLGRA